MKFGKSLQRQIEETLPEWRDKFLSYKYLKKRLNFGSASAPRSTEDEDAPEAPKKRRRIDTQTCQTGSIGILTTEESDFVNLLNPELDKFNVFFTEKEEEYIIRQKELQERIEIVKNRSGPNGMFPCESDYSREMIKVRADIVNFHGELVLLENYSALNYTGLMKIIKKYDKRTGRLLRLAFIERVSQQPFLTTDVLLKLVKECEDTLHHLFPSREQTGGMGAMEASNVALNCCSCNCKGESMLHRSTMAALRTMREMRKGSSTYSVFSLPPLYIKPSNLR